MPLESDLLQAFARELDKLVEQEFITCAQKSFLIGKWGQRGEWCCEDIIQNYRESQDWTGFIHSIVRIAAMSEDDIK